MADPLPEEESPSVILSVTKHRPDRWLGAGIFLLALAALLSTIGLLTVGRQATAAANARAAAARQLNVEVIQRLSAQSQELSCRAGAAVAVNQAAAELEVAIADALVALRENRPNVPGLVTVIDNAARALTEAVTDQRAALTNC